MHSKVLIHSSQVELSSFMARFHKSTSSALQYAVLNLDFLKTGITVAFGLCIGVKITHYVAKSTGFIHRSSKTLPYLKTCFFINGYTT